MQEFTYALIWFISTRERFVVETSKLPKTRRKKGNVVKIIWEDSSTLISQRFDVKILELGSKSVLDKKRLLQEELKEGNKASKIQKTSLEHITKKKKPLFELNGCNSKNQKTSTPSMIIEKPVIKISPQLYNSEQSNLTEIDLLQSNQSTVNNSKNNQSSPIETDEPYHINHNNILPSTSGVQKFVKNHAQISEEHNIFFPKSAITYTEKRTEKSGNSNLSDWKNLVKEALIQIYGSNVGNFCAKGNVTSRTPINSQLFNALYTWANSRSEELITEKEFIQHINKIASNKRKNKNFTLASKTTITTGTSVQKCSLNPSSPGSKQLLYPPKIGSMNRDSGAAYNQDSDSTPSTASPLIFNQHDSSSIQQVNPDPRYDHDLGLRPTQSSTDSLLMPRQYDSSNVQQCYPYSSYSSASYQDQHFNYEYRETYPVSTPHQNIFDNNYSPVPGESKFQWPCMDTSVSDERNNVFMYSSHENIDQQQNYSNIMLTDEQKNYTNL
ncbi:hypothetical protein KQX54_008895 [Cotesia glomerata]|uniref:BEN domain-containing protein n=1 Tax=Cotesia glomerata TaxID=32391 RepID=A0AAV7IX06_COTGL|nr:hypothetical protein KQX54_008895 [Cotesia glomerata]